MRKRIKIEDEKELKLISVEVDVLPRVRPRPKNQMTSAYTQSARDDVNLKTIVKDPLSISKDCKSGAAADGKQNFGSYIIESGPRMGGRRPEGPVGLQRGQAESVEAVEGQDDNHQRLQAFPAAI
jgi:hypothetical protein